jgi:hypothetical protein
MPALLDPKEQGWQRIAEWGPWCLYYRHTNRNNWSTFNLRNYTRDVAKKTYDIRWDGQRIARSPETERLAMVDNGRPMQQLMLHLRRWNPPK